MPHAECCITTAVCCQWRGLGSIPVPAKGGTQAAHAQPSGMTWAASTDREAAAAPISAATSGAMPNKPVPHAAGQLGRAPPRVAEASTLPSKASL